MASATYACPQCGKPIKVSRGNSRNSQQYADWCAKKGISCSDCKQQTFSNDHEAAIAAAAADPANATMPSLVGTEKQIAWAQALRLSALPVIEAAALELLAEAEEETRLTAVARQELKDAIHLLAQDLRSRTDAAAWIDTRDRKAVDMLVDQYLARRPHLCPTATAEYAALDKPKA